MMNGPEAIVQIKPSPEARHLFNRMVARSNVGLHLPLAQCLALSVSRARCGEDPSACQEIHELLSAAWIGPADDGGWLLL